MRGFATWAVVVASLGAQPLAADSCWSYDGNLLRLLEDGDVRALIVEDPGEEGGLHGLQPGRVLFEGKKSGAWYGGRVHDLSAACFATAPVYDVAGPVLQGPLRIELEGMHEVYENCAPTGRQDREVLIITYVGAC